MRVYAYICLYACIAYAYVLYFLLSIQCYAMHGQNINLSVCVCVCVLVSVTLSVNSPIGQYVCVIRLLFIDSLHYFTHVTLVRLTSVN